MCVNSTVLEFNEGASGIDEVFNYFGIKVGIRTEFGSCKKKERNAYVI